MTTKKPYEEFFERHGDVDLQETLHSTLSGHKITVEGLYQAFAARFSDEEKIHYNAWQVVECFCECGKTIKVSAPITEK